MGRRKRERMSGGKKNIIGMLLEEYDIQSAMLIRAVGEELKVMIDLDYVL